MNHKSGSLLFEPQKWITSDLTSEGLGEMFEGDSADTCARKFPLVSMGGRAGARTPIGASGNYFKGINDEAISYKCSLCESVFTRNYVLRRHIATVHGNLDTTFACTMCGKSFGRKDNLQRHSETIHKQGDDNFSCKKCGKGFNRNDNLIRHEKLTCYKT